MKKIAKITAGLLAAVSLFSVVGCKENKEEGSYLQGSNIPQQEGTIHERQISFTQKKLVENGTSEYAVLVKEESRSDISEAINELQNLFREATGVSLPVVLDESVTYDANAKYISLGATEFASAAGVNTADKTLGEQGYRISTKGNSIFISGKSFGVLYGVYDLLKILFEFQTYSNKAYYMEKKTDVNLPELNVKEVPDIAIRFPTTGAQYSNKTTTHRLGLQLSSEILFHEGNAHNITKYIVPLETHIEAHPSWYSGDRTQLCYTARGDQAEYEAMVDVAVANVEKYLDNNPNHSMMALTQMDVQTWCECESCQALEDRYGTNAASQIYFVNDVAEIVETWLNEERGGREVQFMFFAYHKSELAPATKQADGTWKAVDDSVMLRDNVSVWLAPIYENYTISVTSPESINMRTMFESWHAVAKSYSVWAYNVYFDNYLIPYDSYSALQDLIRYFVSNNTKFLWVQGNWNLNNNTGYDDLKEFIISKLMWNCNANVNDLIAEYFDRVYREASDIMESTFWAWRAQSELQRGMNRSGNLYSSPCETKFWPKRYLVEQLEKMDEAKALIAHYEEADPELYQAIYDSIVCETISPRYLLLELYKGTFAEKELAAFKNEFKSDVTRLDFDMISEQLSMDGYLE